MNYSEDESLNVLLGSIVKEVSRYAELQINHIKKLSEIGIALSAEKNLNRLLELIVDEARLFAGADAGTLYLLNEESEALEFAIVQNETMKTRMGGTAGPIKWNPIPLKKDGNPNLSNVSSYAAITGETINIPDVYEAEGFDFSGTREFDSKTGYRSMSMLVIPMKNKDEETIGVLQLINAVDPASRKTVSFAPGKVSLIASLASQAAVAVTNVKLYRDLEILLDSFIKAIAKTIDEKSPFTAGHIRRVQKLTMMLAKAMNGRFKDFRMNDDELKELSMAAWLHDVGKIITPEHVVDKSTKLEKIFDLSALIATRYEVLKRDLRIKALDAKLNECPASVNPSPRTEGALDDEYKAIVEEEKFVLSCNQPGEFMDDSKIERLKEIAKKKWDFDGKDAPYITEEELENLSIRRGTLTPEERKTIESHSIVTHRMLSSLPFPKKLRRVPEYAATHHEKMDGTGYPFGLKGEQLSYPSRIIAIADVFEALTAKDRPYKKPMPLSKALKIMESMHKEGHIDGEILDFFVKGGLYREYAQEELDPSQLDC